MAQKDYNYLKSRELVSNYGRKYNSDEDFEQKIIPIPVNTNRWGPFEERGVSSFEPCQFSWSATVASHKRDGF